MTEIMFEQSENNDNDYEFNKLPIQQLNTLIELAGEISNLVSTHKNFIKNKAEFDKVELMIRSVDKEFLNLQYTIRKSFITTYIEEKKNHIEKKKMRKLMKNTSNSHVNKLKNAKPFILNFMDLDNKDTMISTADILRSFSKFIKEEKEKNNKEIYAYNDNNEIDNTSFKVIGKMKILFEEIKNEANKRGETIIIPEQIGFKNIFSYIKYMF